MRYLKLSSVLAIVAALTLTACGDDDDDRGVSSPSSSSTAGPSEAAPPPAMHNTADVTFLQGMVPHHQQALDMTELAESRASSDQVKSLARQIKAAQDPEIRAMSALLQGMDPELPAGQHDTDHIGPGMMSAHQMQQLEATSGAEFDRMFLQMMIDHHRGAITMSETELRDGQNAEARRLAEQIINVQRQEISTATDLLSGN